MPEEKRRTGKTTRIVDEAIQELFTTGKCVVCDHFVGQGNMDMEKASMRATDLVAQRLLMEHSMVKFERDGCKITLTVPRHATARTQMLPEIKNI